MPERHVLEEGYRGFLIRIPIPDPAAVAPLKVEASVTAISRHAAAHIDEVRWAEVAASEGDLHTLASIRHAIDKALDGA